MKNGTKLKRDIASRCQTKIEGKNSYTQFTWFYRVSALHLPIIWYLLWQGASCVYTGENCIFLGRHCAYRPGIENRLSVCTSTSSEPFVQWMYMRSAQVQICKWPSIACNNYSLSVCYPKLLFVYWKKNKKNLTHFSSTTQSFAFYTQVQCQPLIYYIRQKWKQKSNLLILYFSKLKLIEKKHTFDC